MLPARRYLLLPAAAMLLTACSTGRINQFRRFADAGISYAEAVDALSREAASAAVDADSAVLARTRSSVPQDDRARTVLEHNQLIRQRVEVLADLRRHARLLGAYFVTLASMTDPDVPGEFSVTASDLVESLGVVGARLRTARVGDLAVADFTGSVVKISVAHLQAHVLQRELRARAAVLARELDLQHAAMHVVVEGMRADLAIVLRNQEKLDVVDPYRGNAKLPRNWAKRRREILTASTAIASAEAAGLAARRLGESFRAVVENRFGVAEYLSLMGDIQQTLDLIAAARGVGRDE